MKLENACLLIIDVQVGLFSIDGSPIYNADELLQTIKEMLDRAREAGFPIIFIQHESTPGGILDRTMPGWAIQPEIAPIKGEKIVHKKTPSAFVRTNLQALLDDLQITTLVIAGVQSELCVDSTTRHASFLGYKVILVQDAHSTFDSEVLPAPDIIAQENLVLGGDFATLASACEIEFA
ncbi:MAG TPA: cysteine hydrolase family protein [Candidatus Lokiarchaeia archaeon]|nr:cysteine hydrolase family protein [Candidatus Lokiarchaeia archaeon]